LIEPYGGKLIDLTATGEEREELRRLSAGLPRVRLSERALCDLELLATGGFSPLETFLGSGNYRSVLEEMRLADGTLFPVPVTLTVGADAPVKLDGEVALTDGLNNLLAVLRVEEIYRRDSEREARLVCGTHDPKHPLVAEMSSWGEINISGRLRVIELPPRYDFKALRMSPAEVRERLRVYGRANVVAFQTRNPLHRAHEEMTKAAMQRVGGTLLLHPAVGLTKPGDVDHCTRVRSYKVMFERYYDHSNTLLAILPLAMRMAGPREALWHAIIRRNFGANHLIVGRDHASPGNDSAGRPFYEPYAAQQLLAEHADETGVEPVPFSEFLYLPGEDRYAEASRVPAGTRTASLSGTEVREQLRRGRRLPRWFTRPEVATLLERANPPRDLQGFCVWLTGLSGAGKTTAANILAAKLLEHGRQVTVLDGDVVREHLSKGLGFSKDDRDANIRRIGYVAAEIVRHGGAVVCAAISPYRDARDWCRSLVSEGCFVETFVDAPLEVCEARDPKGMYRQARAGVIKNFTGVHDPYETPTNPEIVLDSAARSAEENAEIVLAFLLERGFILPDSAQGTRNGTDSGNAS
jgi:sulfate adenylyltransferase